MSRNEIKTQDPEPDRKMDQGMNREMDQNMDQNMDHKMDQNMDHKMDQEMDRGADVTSQETEPEMEDAESRAYSRAGRMKRILAIIALVIMAALLIWLIVCIITNSELTIAVLFCNIIYPIILYVMVWLKKVFSRK